MAMCKRAGKFTGAAQSACMRWQVQFKIFRDALSAVPEGRISIVWPRSHTGQSHILLFDLESTHPSAPTRACNVPSARSIAQGRQPQRGDRAAGTRVAQATWVGSRSALRDASTAAVSVWSGWTTLDAREIYFVAVSRDMFRHVMPSAAELRMLCQVPALAICAVQFQKLANNPTKENERNNGVHVP
jgi:hypothetical protein